MWAICISSTFQNLNVIVTWRLGMANAVAAVLRDYTVTDPLEDLYSKLVAWPDVRNQIESGADGRFKLAKDIYLFGRHGKRDRKEAALCDYFLLRLFESLESNPFLVYLIKRLVESAHGMVETHDNWRRPIANQTGATGVMVELLLIDATDGLDTLKRHSYSSICRIRTTGAVSHKQRALRRWLENQWFTTGEIDDVLGASDPLEELEELHEDYALGENPPAPEDVRQLVTRASINDDLPLLEPFNLVTDLVLDALLDVNRNLALTRMCRLGAAILPLTFIYEHIRDKKLTVDESRRVLYDFVLYHLNNPVAFDLPSELPADPLADIKVQRLARLLVRLREIGALGDIHDYSMLFQAFLPWAGRIPEAHQLAFSHIGG